MKKKIRIWFYSFIVMVFIFFIVTSCEKDNDINKVMDIDGNVYNTITIGTQTWMVENLKTTKYSNGDPIPNITDNKAWHNLTTGAYCNYNNVPDDSAIYGKLYNWYAVDDSRNIAPIGWHVPSDAEWTALTNYLGGDSVAADKLKESGTIHWSKPLTGSGASNESGFTALPGGWRYYSGEFLQKDIIGYWWSSTECYAYIAYSRKMYYEYIGMDYPNQLLFGSGLSIRCVKD